MVFCCYINFGLFLVYLDFYVVSSILVLFDAFNLLFGSFIFIIGYGTRFFFAYFFLLELSMVFGVAGFSIGHLPLYSMWKG